MSKRALDILTDDPDRIKPFLTDIYNPVIGAAGGFLGMCFLNFMTRRPVFSGLFSLINKKYENYVSPSKCLILGIQKHVAATAIGGVIGKVADNWRNEHMAKRDAILRHYVELHPEDFPDIGKQSSSQYLISLFINLSLLERKKFADVIEMWVPIR